MRQKLQQEEEDYRMKRRLEDIEYVNMRKREAETLCISSPFKEASTMAETKEKRNGPMKAFDMPRQI